LQNALCLTFTARKETVNTFARETGATIPSAAGLVMRNYIKTNNISKHLKNKCLRQKGIIFF